MENLRAFIRNEADIIADIARALLYECVVKINLSVFFFCLFQRVINIYRILIMIALDDYTNLNDEFIISADMVFSPYIFILFYHSRLNVKRTTKKTISRKKTSNRSKPNNNIYAERKKNEKKRKNKTLLIR